MSTPKTIRLQSILARIKPFNELHRSHQTDINHWKNEFHNPYFTNYDRELVSCLVTLGVPQLEPYLAWIPFHQFKSFDQLAEGGFAKVYKASIYMVGTSVAAKELKISMVAEVRLIDYTPYFIFHVVCH